MSTNVINRSTTNTKLHHSVGAYTGSGGHTDLGGIYPPQQPQSVAVQYSLPGGHGTFTPSSYTPAALGVAFVGSLR